jgi:hypothetical protein
VIAGKFELSVVLGFRKHAGDGRAISRGGWNSLGGSYRPALISPAARMQYFLLETQLHPPLRSTMEASQVQVRVVGAVLNVSGGHAGKIYPLYGSKKLIQSALGATPA